MALDLAEPIDVTPAVLTSTTVTDSTPAWASGTTYAAGDMVQKDAADGKGRLWLSAAGSNIGHDPVTDDGTHWVDQGPTNDWAMFSDEGASIQSTATDLIDVNLQLGAADQLSYAFFVGLQGTSLQIIATDATDGEVYNTTFSLVSDSGIVEWFAWFSLPIERLSEKLVSDLPPLYSGLQLEILIAEAGATVGCAAVVMGLGRTIANTQWGVQIGRRDFSIFQDNDFGERVVVERGYRKTVVLTAVLDNTLVDDLAQILARFRATKALFVADPNFSSLAIWGFVKNFQVQIPGPAASFASLEFESATQ